MCATTKTWQKMKETIHLGSPEEITKFSGEDPGDNTRAKVEVNNLSLCQYSKLTKINQIF